MAFSPSLAKARYENLSVEELEAEYEKLKKNYCFENKEEQVGYIIDNYLHSSNSTNNNSIRTALEELLKEKTGKEYTIEPKRFEINLNDIINYVTNPAVDPFWTTAISDFFQKLNEVSEEDKMRFLIELVQDKTSYNEFTREITKPENVNEIYEKYSKIAHDYVLRHSIKG